MKKLLATITTSATIALLSAGPLLAQGWVASYSRSSCSIWRPWNCGTHNVPPTPVTPTTPASVPEIDASTGLLAIAAVLAVLIFVWERRRRHAA
ncbi:MAG: VPEID-CTERM sorting domain-containing protein [Paracoccaceae bacterium]|nr:VPEID-CTERM sorting domain-containing protein [Paracoccaceae bacterium]